MGEFSQAPSTASGPPPSRREALRIRNLTDKSEFELKPHTRMRKPSFGFRSHHIRQRGLPRKSEFEFNLQFLMPRSAFDLGSHHKCVQALACRGLTRLRLVDSMYGATKKQHLI